MTGLLHYTRPLPPTPSGTLVAPHLGNRACVVRNTSGVLLEDMNRQLPVLPKVAPTELMACCALVAQTIAKLRRRLHHVPATKGVALQILQLSLDMPKDVAVVCKEARLLQLVHSSCDLAGLHHVGDPPSHPLALALAWATTMSLLPVGLRILTACCRLSLLTALNGDHVRLVVGLHGKVAWMVVSKAVDVRVLEHGDH